MLGFRVWGFGLKVLGFRVLEFLELRAQSVLTNLDTCG